MLLQKYEQFGDPFYSEYSERIFAGSYEKLAGEKYSKIKPNNDGLHRK